MTATTPTRVVLRQAERVHRSPVPTLAAAVLAFGATAVLLTGTTGAVQTAVVLTALLVVPGTAVVRPLRLTEPIGRAALVVVTSAAVDTVVALAMVWTGHWTPVPAAGLVLVVSGWATLAHGIVAARSTDRVSLRRAVGAAWAARREGTVVRLAVGGGVLVAGVATWAVGTAQTTTGVLGEWGLLTAVTPTWWVGAGAVLAVTVVALVDRRFPAALRVAAAAVLVVVVYGTANLTAAEPRPPWVFKHVAVTAYIQQHGAVDPAIDIYNRWPGFFAVSAFLGSATSTADALAPVRFVEVAFALVDAALVLGIASTLGLRGRWAVTAAVVFSAANWVGQDYYSPQAFAFALFLAVVLVVLTALRRSPNALGRAIVGVASRLLRARRDPIVPTAGVAAAGSRGGTATVTAVVLVVLLQAVISASHQLTPYVLVAAFVPLVAVGVVRPWWTAVPVTVAPLLYLLPNLDYVQEKFGLVTGFDPLSNATAATTSIAIPSLATTLQSRGVLVLTALVAIVALVGVVRMVRAGHGHRALLVLWLAASPAVLVLGQSYGGEGRLRVVLFSAPFLAIAAVHAVHGRRVRLGATAALVVVTTVLFVTTTFQAEQSNRTPAGEVAAARWLDTRFTGDDTLTTVGSFPAIVGADYPAYLERWGQVQSLEDLTEWYPRGMSPTDLDESLADRAHGGVAWLVFSDTERAEVVERGTATGPEVDALERATARQGTLRYDRDGVRVYEVARGA
ncbi:hypothetical protein NS263_04945 [Curtobacterium oceanosedimentum]|uniref:Glycosyltransferase RgtA/B/C/D-like domain-containing protein n=1 Tax=Curtobacterium oceanosedimentum TaxID=465820 RepID=A0ABR5S823_9MICO|nr:hypothetical protein [Curtobacterium oceanosedimentum]KTR41333.1 hypothetical protein NS263_04945 [Curtobacterium oceanosedimentum]